MFSIFLITLNTICALHLEEQIMMSLRLRITLPNFSFHLGMLFS